MTELLEHVARGFEVVGVFTLVVGLLFAVTLALVTWARSRDGRRAYRALRETFGGVLLLALEILVAADLIQTVAVTPTLGSVLTLGLIVLIRTFLSFSLQVEMEGDLPWRRALRSGAQVTSEAVRRAGRAD
ncbi:DUF1622 domain-containing protein [Ammonicoccus fulvus]|uniref:DUF1622 domain-containing protein n=1 Tax=Ammonicoccus fulvus TaxID=3138240 RepID=A0ABZ3FSA7_9ACTN